MVDIDPPLVLRIATTLLRLYRKEPLTAQTTESSLRARKRSVNLDLLLCVMAREHMRYCICNNGSLAIYLTLLHSAPVQYKSFSLLCRSGRIRRSPGPLMAEVWLHSLHECNAPKCLQGCIAGPSAKPLGIVPRVCKPEESRCLHLSACLRTRTGFYRGGWFIGIGFLVLATVPHPSICYRACASVVPPLV